MDQLSGKNSYELIDNDIIAGLLTAEQGLVYKVYALFSDAELPSKYIGNKTLPPDADMVMQDVIVQVDSLSEESILALTPFFIPPNDPLSWYYHPHLGGSKTAHLMGADAPSWVSIPAVGGKIRVFYWSDNADDAAKAATIAAEFDSRIWTLTNLMNQEPIPNVDGATDLYLWDSYLKNDGSVVSLTDEGVTVPRVCAQTGVVIYLNDQRPIGTLNSSGMIQTATHEFMHALQDALPLNKCKPSYKWLMEATAMWSEDHIYPLAKSEHPYAKYYLKRPSVRLDDTDDLHHYGAYLLFYYLTHTVDPSAQVVAQTWQNCIDTENTYQAIDDAVNQIVPEMHDFYWTGFLASLWNKAPFYQYYKMGDQLDETVVPVEGNSTTPITASSGQGITQLPAEIPTGGAVYRHLSFPGDSVRSVTVLNGMGYKLRIGPASENEELSPWVEDGDKTYLFDDISYDDLTGANLILLMKVEGLDGQSLPMITPYSNFQDHGFCLDAQGKIEDMVVILSNWDVAHPDRIMKPLGLPTTIFANNIPCDQLSGTSSHSFPMDSYGYVVGHTQATISYENLEILDYDYLYPVHVFPVLYLSQVSAQVSWDISGGHDNYWYTGSGNYSAGETSGEIEILQGVLAGGPSYRGYGGSGYPDDDTEISYVYHWTDDDGEYSETLTEYAWQFLDTYEAVQYHGAYYPVEADGSFSASGSYTDEEGATYTWDWNLTSP